MKSKFERTRTGNNNNNKSTNYEQGRTAVEFMINHTARSAALCTTKIEVIVNLLYLPNGSVCEVNN